MNTDVNKRDNEAGQSSVDTNVNKSRDLEAAQRIKFGGEDLERLGAGELRSSWRKQDAYIDSLEKTIRAQEDKISNLTQSEEKLKQQLSEMGIKEKILIRRLINKEQELQEYARELSEMKNSSGNSLSSRSIMVDPAVNLIIQKLRQELTTTKTKLEDTQNELNAWKFTPDSNTGKRLMAKCRLLYQENEELGRMISSGRLAKLEGELALQKSFGEEVKKSQSEMDELLQDLDEDVEGMQSTIYYLQQELRRLKRDGATPSCNGLENNHQSDPQQQRTANNPEPRTLVKNNDSRKRTTPLSENSELNYSDSLDLEQPQAKKTQNHLNGLANSPPP